MTEVRDQNAVLLTDLKQESLIWKVKAEQLEKVIETLKPIN